MKAASQLIGWVLLALAIVAVGYYIFHGNWGAVAVVVGSSVLGKILLGIAEMAAIPFTLPAISLAKRGNTVSSVAFFFLSTLVTKAGFAAFCVVVLWYFLRTPGPPGWISAALAWTVAGAPFYWGKMHAHARSAKNIDYQAANIGMPIAGALSLAGIPLVISVTPLITLFAVSTVISTIWWANSGAPKVRLEELLRSMT